MDAVFRSVSPRRLEQALADTALLEALLDGNDAPGSSGGHCYLEKSRDAIHFLLTAESQATGSPLSAAIHGCHEVGLDRPAGPVRYLSPEEVRDLSSRLSEVPREELARRYSPARLTQAGVYPNVWHEDADALDWLLDEYDALTAFYARAAQRDEAVLLYIG
jgi:hypothetical protein